MFIDPEIEHKAVSILRAYPDQKFSFCDACSFVVIEEKELREVFTFDRKDFRIYKFKQVVKFI